MKWRLAALCLPAALALLLAGCHESNSPKDEVPPAQTQTSPAVLPLTEPAGAPAKVVVYVLNPKATTEEGVLMPHEITLRHPEAPAKDAIEALLEAKHSPLAPTVSLRGLSVDGGIATLDFSENPIKTGGEGAQSAGLNALALTLGQFPAINQYQIKVQGTEVKSFGEFTTDGPMDVIRPGARPVAGDSQ